MAGTHCESCKFFDDSKSGGEARSDRGLCRYNPPVTQPAPDAKGLWPVVASSDWCGHYTSAMVAAE